MSRVRGAFAQSLGVNQGAQSHLTVRLSEAYGHYWAPADHPEHNWFDPAKLPKLWRPMTGEEKALWRVTRNALILAQRASDADYARSL